MPVASESMASEAAPLQTKTRILLTFKCRIVMAKPDSMEADERLERALALVNGHS
jgi:hypothetical protein